jgi:hypothetical protein
MSLNAALGLDIGYVGRHLLEHPDTSRSIVVAQCVRGTPFFQSPTSISELH